MKLTFKEDPRSVTSIGDYAFGSCTGLTSVMIPGSITNLEIFAFEDCISLTNAMTANGVSSIGKDAFKLCTSLPSVTIPGSATYFGDFAFYNCSQLASVTMANGLTSIGTAVFNLCPKLIGVTIPGSVSTIGNSAFFNCTNLTYITIPNGVSNLMGYAFYGCFNLASIYCLGNTPSPTNDSTVFSGDNRATVYYLPETVGWGPTFDDRPTMLWNPQVQRSAANFGVRTNRFGFSLTGTSGLVIVVEACTNLTGTDWQPLQTNTLTGGEAYFSDPQWTNYPGRFYRLRSR